MSNQYTKAAERAAAGLPPIPRAPRPARQPAPVPAKPKRVRRTRAQIEAARAQMQAQQAAAIPDPIAMVIPALAHPTIGQRLNAARPWIQVIAWVVIALAWGSSELRIRANAKAFDSVMDQVAAQRVPNKSQEATKPLTGQCFGCSDADFVAFAKHSPAQFRRAAIRGGVPQGLERSTGTWVALDESTKFDCLREGTCAVGDGDREAARTKVAPAQAVPQGSVAPDARSNQANHGTDTATVGG